jgi:hypothetical protein
LGKFSNGKFIGHSDNQVTARWWTMWQQEEYTSDYYFPT